MFETPGVPARRVRRSREEWQALLEDHHRSGLTAQQYCTQHQLNADRFRFWQRRLDTTVLDGLFVEVQQDDAEDNRWTIELNVGDLSLRLRR